MRIPVLLIAGLIALGPAAHAAEAPSANEAPPAAVTAPPPAPSTAGQENAVTAPTTDADAGTLHRRGERRSRADDERRRGAPGSGAGRRPPGGPGSRAFGAPRDVSGTLGAIPGVPVDGLHRRRASGPHQVHERADEEELHLRRAGAGEDHDHLPPPGDARRGVRSLPLRAAGEGVHHRHAGEHDQDRRRPGSPPGHDPHRRRERHRVRGVHHPARSAAVPRERRGRPAGGAAGLQGRNGLRVRILQHAAADRLARQYRPDRHDPRRGRQRGDRRGPSGLPAGLRRRDRGREDADLDLP